MQPAQNEEVNPEQRLCPDEGTCHHQCFDGPCFRVGACGPLSGVFPDNRWPKNIALEENNRQ